jgi:small-conductance mechanosensitive channel
MIALAGVLAGLAPAQPSTPADKPDKTTRSGPKLVELHKVANEDLLKHALLLLERDTAAYRAQLRELATLELAYDAARKQTDAVPVPGEATGPEPTDPGEAARAALDRARLRLDALKKRVDLSQAEKAVADRIVTSAEATRSAALAHANLLDDMDAFAVEIDLRVKDRTLPADAVPKALERESLTQRKQELAADQDRLRQKAQAAQKQAEAAGQRLEAAKKAALDADAAFGQATRKAAREQKRQDAEKALAMRPAPEVEAELARMIDEEAGLAGAFDLARQGFHTRETKAADRRHELAGLQSPRPANGDAIADAEAQQTFTAKRTKAVESLRDALQEMIERGGRVEGEAAVLDEHLLKEQVAVGVLKKAGLTVAGEDPAVRLKKVAEASGAIAATVEKAKAELPDLTQNARTAHAAEEEATKRLADLKATQEASKPAREFEERLRKQSAAEVVADFTTVSAALVEKTQALEKDRERFEKAQAAVAELRGQREALKDPFLRRAETEAQAEKQKLLDDLKKQAGLDRAPRDGSSMMMSMPGGEGTPGVMSMQGMVPMMVVPETKKDTDKEKDKGKVAETLDPLGLPGFQQLLAARVRTAQEQAETDGRSLKALAEAEKAGEDYAKAMGEARQLALRRYAAAIDLKKRVGRGEMKGDAVPEGVGQALQREGATKLEAAATALVAAQAATRQEQERLGRPDPIQQVANGVLKDALGLASQRLDLLADLKRLELDAQRERKDLSESDVKRVEQAAGERQRKEDSWAETLVSIDNSTAAKALVDALQAYYREVVALEERQDLFKQQKETVEKLVELTRQEAALLQKVRPQLKEQIAALEQRREEESTLTRARLRPEEADELLRAYQARTGKQLPRPVAVPEKDRPAVVRDAGAALFDRLLDVQAARNWQGLVEGRLSPAGLAAEAGTYQDRLGALAAASASNARRLVTLGGKPSGEATPEAPAVTEIAAARKDLFEVRRDGVLWILGKVFVVLVLAYFLPKLLTRLLQRATGGDDGTARAHSRLVVAFIQAFLKLVIYTIALVVILSILGFDITAILAGLGIGGLAIGLASQNALADMLGGLIIFLERPFAIGDTVKIGESEAAQVVGLTWRITQLKSADGVAINIPNRRVTEATIVNLTRTRGRTFDTVAVSVPATYPVAQVVGWIEEALAGCTSVVTEAGTGVSVDQMTVMTNGTYYVRYQPFYYIHDLARRDEARQEVLGKVAAVLAARGVIVNHAVPVPGPQPPATTSIPDGLHPVTR